MGDKADGHRQTRSAALAAPRHNAFGTHWWTLRESNRRGRLEGLVADCGGGRNRSTLIRTSVDRQQMTLDEYEKEQRSRFAALAETIAAILESALKQRRDIHVQQVQHRAKSP